jgi:hypothetical protein
MSLRVLHIPGQRYDAAKGLLDLDPVTAFLEDFEPGRGQLTLVCWGRAWTHFWGAMGDGVTLAEFVGQASTGYIVHKLMLPLDVMLKRAGHREERWLTQIVEALKIELNRAAIARVEGKV